MASGVTVSTNAKTTYEEVKKDRRYRYIIYYIKDERVIEVESTGDREKTYAEFLQELDQLKTDCRYCVFDYPVQVEVDGHQEASSMSVNRLVLMRWCPENAKIKQKMLYSSSYEALKRALVGIYKYVQACEWNEASEEEINKALKKQ